MLRNARLKMINLTSVAVLTFVAVLIAILLTYMVKQISTVKQGWLHYQADRSEKARLESVLRASIGYGGMIHNFKNYVLRGRKDYLNSTKENLGAAKAAIRQYRSLVLNETESLSLDDIEAMLNAYQQALMKAKELRQTTAVPEVIDREVKVDDTRALRSLQALEVEISKKAGGSTVLPVKGRMVATLRASIGYGAMIHDFKNMVIRHDFSLAEGVRTDIDKSLEVIGQFRALGVTLAEKLALQDVEHTLIAYRDKIRIAERMFKEGASSSDVDKAVKVDDTLALRGLTTLDREVARQVDVLSDHVGLLLEQVLALTKAGSIMVLVGTGLAFLLSMWLFNHYIVLPYRRSIRLMERLSSGDTEIMGEINGLELQNEIGEMDRTLVTFREYILFRQQSEKEAKRQAATDPLTGLDNRKRFEERLYEAIDLAKRTGAVIGCLMIDLDGFKKVNDTYGHGAGDEVLKEVANRLLGVCRSTDFPARLGGDEFAVLLTAIDDIKMAEIPARRIIDQLNLPIYVGEVPLNIGGSVGIAGYPDHADSPKELMEAADKALYKSKDNGKGQFAMCSK